MPAPAPSTTSRAPVVTVPLLTDPAVELVTLPAGFEVLSSPRRRFLGRPWLCPNAHREAVIAGTRAHRCARCGAPMHPEHRA